MQIRLKKAKRYVPDIEEIIGGEAATEDDLREVPLTRSPFLLIGAMLAAIIAVFSGRLGYLDFARGNFFRAIAMSNMTETSVEEAPRGLIEDREGDVIADNAPTFQAMLDVGIFTGDPAAEQAALRAIQNVLGIPPDAVFALVSDAAKEENPAPVVLSGEVTHDQALALQGYNVPGLTIAQGFLREYRDPFVYATVLGYTGFAGPENIAKDPILTYRDLVGKAGIEYAYDRTLRGTPGALVAQEDAKGHVIGTREEKTPQIGGTVRLTLDGGLQTYFYNRLKQGLTILGRDVGVGIAINPQNGEILSLVQIPSYDNGILSSPGHGAEKAAILTSPLSPLFDRAVGGGYSPGSTIKPLVGIAALAEGVITPQKEIFSPGYLDVPNPYDPAHPTRYLDWRYQGYVNMASAIAKSSDVYFYAVGGGAFDVRGLGIGKLDDWWKKFGLGEPTGIDLPNEASGFLPTPDWKEKTTGHPWLLGDTYNVSIGQGDLLLTPMQIIDYIAAIGANGKMYAPVVNLDTPHPALSRDLSGILSEIRVIQEGMKETVTTPEGTAYTLHDLPFSVAAKTGSAQILNNTQENAFFVGYAPATDPQIAVLVLIEHSREGSLNAVPIAKDVLNWYYQNRIKK